LFFTANPQSSEDPFSKRFINPYLTELLQHGIYEDEMHLIIMVNYSDNPWFPAELEMERKWDYEHLDRAEYDHIWNGAFNDSVEGSLIRAEWFDACIDAHKKLGFVGVGQKMAAHDPSDEGSDSKGYAARHGSVVYDVQEMTTGNVNEGCDWATGLAINQRVDAYTWDCDGMGVALNAQTAKAFNGKAAVISQFKGSEAVDNPDAIYDHVEGSKIQGQKTNKQAVKNKRAQYYYELRKRVLRTYEAVNGTYHDPDTLISFDSSIVLMAKLRSELCRMPIKPNGNGLFELYTKVEMKGPKFKIDSPNLGDCVMMLMRQPHIVTNVFVRPPPIRVMGRR
jgi:phage terminase large subunit